MLALSTFAARQTSLNISAVLVLLLVTASATSAWDCSAVANLDAHGSVFSSALDSQQLTSCSDPNTPTCGWYTSCMEKSAPCGPTGYVLSFGYPYCKKFASARDLSPIGQQWRNKTMICLQQSLVPMLGASGPLSQICPEIETLGFSSHVQCYVSEPSICSLPWSDLFNIIDIIGPNGFMDPVGWQQVLKVARICTCQWSGLC